MVGVNLWICKWGFLTFGIVVLFKDRNVFLKRKLLSVCGSSFVGWVNGWKG